MQQHPFFSLKLGGQAGQGIKSSGLILSKLANRSGYHVYDYTEYPSLIKGGHNVIQINFALTEVLAPSQKTDLLIALNQETLNLHVTELTDNSGVLFDSEARINTTEVKQNVNLYGVPFSKLAKEAGGMELLSNTVALGATIALLGGNINLLKELLNEEYKDKGEKILLANEKAAELGYEYTISNFTDKLRLDLKPIDAIDSPIPKILINGNEAVALGAIAGGLQFAAIYPMSPVSNILHILAANQEKFGYVYKQPEDEISAINMSIGAAFAGARSMTSTSGGGFCLMTEGYGLAGMTETPLVIIEGMRGAPATGLPTWSEQGDLRFILHAHQGDFPRIVLAAGDAQEAFYLTMQAFNLAEKYQTPVVVVIDKNICENDQSFRLFDTSAYKIDRGKFTTQKIEDYKRYDVSPDGISERSIPGVGNFFIGNSDEHNVYGYSTEEISDRNQQMNKRMTKLETCANEDMPIPQLFGPENADITLVSWGSNKGGIIQALRNFDNVNYLHLTWMNPFPSQKVYDVLSRAKYIIDVEANYTGQLAGIIREKTGIEIKDKFLKYDGRPFFVEELISKIEGALKG